MGIFLDFSSKYASPYQDSQLSTTVNFLLKRILESLKLQVSECEQNMGHESSKILSKLQQLPKDFYQHILIWGWPDHILGQVKTFSHFEICE